MATVQSTLIQRRTTLATLTKNFWKLRFALRVSGSGISRSLGYAIADRLFSPGRCPRCAADEYLEELDDD